MLLPLTRLGQSGPAEAPTATQARKSLQFAEDAVTSATANAESVYQALRAVVIQLPREEHDRWLRVFELTSKALVSRHAADWHLYRLRPS